MQRARQAVLTSILCLSIVVATGGCGAGSNRINRVGINMSKEEVRALIGNDYISRGGKVDKDGNIIDLWEVTDQKTKALYQIYFLNNQVAQWGRPEDLKAFPELFEPSSPRNRR